MSKLWADFETYCEVPIEHGTFKYAASAEVMLFAWALDDLPAMVWDLAAGEPMPYDLEQALFDPALETWFHNAMFDRNVWGAQRQGPLAGKCPPLERWRDTMVQAMAHSLPGSLVKLCDVLGIGEDKAKSKRGDQLIRLFCVPQPFKHSLERDKEGGETVKQFKARVDAAKAVWVGRATRHTHPREWEEFKEYARLDVEAMREAHRLMPKWNYPNNASEVALWHLDQRVNARGVAIDVDLAVAALATVEAEKKVLAQHTQLMTNGEVKAATQRDAMLAHILEAYGIAMADMTGATLDRMLNDDDIPAGLKELLIVRQQASTTSVSKYKTLVRSVNLDGRLRGLLQFCGAGRTGRWSGRLFQPQNLPRPKHEAEEIEIGIAAIIAGVAGLIYDDLMGMCSSAIRGAIIAGGYRGK
jgi:DNA polymerase